MMETLARGDLPGFANPDELNRMYKEGEFNK